MVFFGCGIQLVAMQPSSTVSRELKRTGRVTWRGFEAIIGSGVNSAELHRKIQEKHEASFYRGLSEDRVPLISRQATKES